MSRIAYGIEDAAVEVGVSPDTIRRAIKAVDPKAYPPPLRAGRHGKNGRYSILHRDLEEWAGLLARWAS